MPLGHVLSLIFTVGHWAMYFLWFSQLAVPLGHVLSPVFTVGCAIGPSTKPTRPHGSPRQFPHSHFCKHDTLAVPLGHAFPPVFTVGCAIGPYTFSDFHSWLCHWAMYFPRFSQLAVGLHSWLCHWAMYFPRFSQLAVPLGHAFSPVFTVGCAIGPCTFSDFHSWLCHWAMYFL